MMPIIELQRRMYEAGRIRAGDRANGNPRKLDKWRLTSKDKQRLDHASKLWGGTVRQWLERPDEWDLHTDTPELPIMLLPGQAPTTWYELWSKGGAQRRCDGQHELISDGPCLCDPEERECKPHTRLSVLLPDLPGVGSWLVQSTGWNAAAELAGAAELLAQATAQGLLLPARLRLEQRSSTKEGLTRKFAVPVIDIDISFRDLLAGESGGREQPVLEAVASTQTEPLLEAAPLGHTPIPPELEQGVTLQEGLEIAAKERKTRSGRQPAPIPKPDEIPFGETAVPVPDDEPGPTPAGGGDATAAQKKKLNVLVGTLRKENDITTEQLYSALAKSRELDPEIMVQTIDGARGIEEGELHWAPLRDTLSKAEASDLIERLERLEHNIRVVEEETS